MIFNQFNKKNEKRTILISPLDWGLGHATRCIVIIKELEAINLNVVIAAEGTLKAVLQNEFPAFTFISCPQYKIRYSKNKFWLPFKLLIQVPKIVLTIIIERFWLKNVLKKHKIDGIISDNRFGLYHSTIPSVYITHQLLIKTDHSFTENIAQKIHYWFIKKYTFCWIPDFEGSPNLAGELSHPVKKLANIQYVGCLSRFVKIAAIEKNLDLLCIISGPEPQRTILEKLLTKQVKTFNGNVLIIRGLPGDADIPSETILKKEGFTGIIETKNHLPSPALNMAIQQSKMVVCRSGYTSVMDLVKLQQKAIFIPTPGQTEQEYLADHLLKEKVFFSTTQDNFQLNNALQAAENFPYLFPTLDMDFFKKQVHEFAQSI